MARIFPHDHSMHRICLYARPEECTMVWAILSTTTVIQLTQTGDELAKCVSLHLEPIFRCKISTCFELCSHFDDANLLMTRTCFYARPEECTMVWAILSTTGIQSHAWDELAKCVSLHLASIVRCILDVL
jgi:hypothetical protein